MALGVEGKILRVSSFLVAFTNRQVMTALYPSGMNPQEVERGWSFVMAAAEPSLVDEGPAGEDPTTLLDRLDEWENQHLDVIDAVLTFEFPKLRGQVMAGVSRTDGAELVLSVGALVERVLALKRKKGEAREAFVRLAAHGITDDVLAEATALLERLKGGATMPNAVTEKLLAEQRTRRDAAVTTMWGWYLKWSAIARARIKEPALLRKLGFKRRGRPRKSAEPTEPPRS